MIESAPATPARRGAAVVALAGLLLAGATACTAGPPAPDATAGLLAEGLSSADLSDVPLLDATAQEAEAELTTATEALDPLRPRVEVGEIVVDDEVGTATAELRHTWDVDAGDQDWTYTTTARLELVEDEWAAHWTSFLIAPDLQDGEVLTTQRTRAERAPVLGADGAVLVEPRPVLRLGTDKTRVGPDEQPDAAARIAELLELDPDAYADRVAAAGEKAFVEALVVREETPGVDLEAFRAIDGALAVEDTLPLAPTRRFARPILGTAGPATAEIIEESDGAIVAGDTAGLSGLQRQYDEQLRGRPGLSVSATTAGENSTSRELFSLDPVPGEPLATTLDPEVQDTAETVLADVGPASAVVAVRPSTGAVLAAASGPGSDGYSAATLGTYAPGSVFKVVSSLALLRAGLTPQSTVDCPESTEVDGRTFTNFPGYPASATGSIDLRTAVAHSCNTAFIGARQDAPADALVDAAASLGLGIDADLGYPAFLGSVPADSEGTDHAASMIGQGRIQASPLAMATVAASVAGGETVTPWLVGETAPDGAAATPLTAAEAEALRELMRAVVTDGGADFLQDVPGDDVLAKTGTAEVGSGDERHNHAWMIAVQGDLAVAVFVEDGDYGSTTAGPLLEEFLVAVG